MAPVRRRSAVPIMADESVFTPQDALELIRYQAADVLSLYPGKHGGIRATQHVVKLAEVAGVPCTIGSNLEREVATAAMAHVTVCIANLQCERFPGDLIEVCEAHRLLRAQEVAKILQEEPWDMIVEAGTW